MAPLPPYIFNPMPIASTGPAGVPIPRPFNPFLANDPALARYLMAPQIGGGQPGPLQPPSGGMPPPVQPRETFDGMVEQPTKADDLWASASRGKPAPLDAGGPFGGARTGVKDFLGSDSALAFAAGLLSGGSSSQALGRGFSYAYQAGKPQRDQAQRSQTAAYFEKAGRPDLAEMARLGYGKEAFSAFLGKGDTSESETRIRALVQRGMPRKDAEDVVYGFAQVVVDPTTQTPFLVNKATNQSKPIAFDVGASGMSPSSEGSPTAPSPFDAPPSAPTYNRPKPYERRENGSLWDKAGSATGLWGTIKAVGSDVLGQLPGANVSAETVEARQDFSIAQQNLVRVLQNSPRFAEGERKTIEKEIDIQPSAFKSDEGLRSRLIAVDRNARRRLADIERDANDPYLGAEDRRHARALVEPLRRFIDQLGVPEQASASTPKRPAAGPAIGAIEDGYRFRGGNPADPNSWELAR